MPNLDWLRLVFYLISMEFYLLLLLLLLLLGSRRALRVVSLPTVATAEAVLT